MLWLPGPLLRERETRGEKVGVRERLKKVEKEREGNWEKGKRGRGEKGKKEKRKE